MAQKNFPIRDPHEVKITLKLPAQNRLLIKLKHAENMLLQLDLQSGEVIDWIKPHQETVSTPDKEMAFKVVTIYRISTNRTPYLLRAQPNLCLFSKAVQI